MERADYAKFPSLWDDPHMRKWNLWGYVDESHVAESVRRGLADVRARTRSSSPRPDTVMKRPSRELMAEVFPGVPVKTTWPSTARRSASTRPARYWATRRSSLARALTLTGRERALLRNGPLIRLPEPPSAGPA
jgi:hypothetical protein